MTPVIITYDEMIKLDAERHAKEAALFKDWGLPPPPRRWTKEAGKAWLTKIAEDVVPRCLDSCEDSPFLKHQT